MMIRNVAANSEKPLVNEDVSLCQRVFYHVCAARRIKDRQGREKLARSIIDSYQHGMRDEGGLRRLFI